MKLRSRVGNVAKRVLDCSVSGSVLVILSPLFKGLSWVFLTIFIAGFSWMIMAQVVRSQTVIVRSESAAASQRPSGEQARPPVIPPSRPTRRSSP